MKQNIRENLRLVLITIVWFILMFFIATSVTAQTIGTIKTEQYKAKFEKDMSIDTIPEFHGKPIPIQLLNIGVTPELYESFPELKDKRVGLGLTNIVVEYLEYTERFLFTEDKTEIKNRMVKQFQASQSGITEDKLDG